MSAGGWFRLVVVMAGCHGLWPSSVLAQSAGAPVGGRFEVAVGVTRAGGTSLGTRDATLTGSAGNRLPLFSADTSLEAASGVEADLGVSLSRTFQLEGRVSYGRPELRASLANDVEQAAPITATERIQEFVVGAALVAHVRRWQMGAGGVPFVFVAAAYLRDLHEGQTFVETGQEYHAGGGLKYQFLTRTNRRLKGIGIRGDVSAVARVNGARFDGRTHVGPEVGAALFARF